MGHKTLVEVLLHQENKKNQGIFFIESVDQTSFLSYAALMENARKWLSRLRQAGIGKGDELVLQIDDNRLFIELFWTCLLGGMIPVPLQVVRNEETNLKLRNVWECLRNPSLVTSQANYERLSLWNAGHPVGDVILQRTFLPENIIHNDEPADIFFPSPTDIAFIQFSSGSTGNPKGVILTHENLLANIVSIHAGIHSPATGDTFFSWMPLTHDMGLIGFHLTPLFAGWNHYIMPTDLFIRFPHLWLQKISQYKLTFTASPDFGYKYVLKYFEKHDSTSLDLSSLRVIVNGAEPISFDVCRDFSEKMAQYQLRNNVLFPVYGLAEASLAVSFSEVDEPTKALLVDRNSLNFEQEIRIIGDAFNSVALVCVGKPVAGTFVRIVNSHNMELPEHFIGQIQIKGKNVSSGYYNNPTVTDELIKDGWLHTGDLGVMVAGELYVTGRMKDVFFVNGQNYYPYDLERIAEEIKAIGPGKIVIAGCRIPPQQGESVLAFIQYRGQDMEQFNLLTDNCRQLIQQRTGVLIDQFIPVSAIPKTTSGKVQRFKLVDQFNAGNFEEVLQKLAVVRAAGRKTGIRLVAGNATEEAVIALLKKALGIEDISIDDSFSELGGNSLMAGQLAGLVREEIGVEISLIDLFEYPVIATFVKYVSDKTTIPVSTPVIIKAAEQDSYPLASAQYRLFYHWLAGQDTTAYNVPIALSINGILDVSRLQNCFETLLLRHESLRSSFAFEGDTPVRKVHAAINCHLDVTDVDENTLSFLLLALIKPFDLYKGPLCRGTLLRLNTNRHVLFLDFHHIIMDGTAVTILLKELFDLYDGKILSSQPYVYRDFTTWENQERLTASYVRQAEFFREMLQGDIPVLQLATDYERPAVRNDTGKRAAFHLSPTQVAALKALALAEGATLPLLLLAVYQVLLAKYSKQDDIIVGLPVSGRNHPGFFPVVGMFVNNLFIRSRPAAYKPFRAYLAEVRQIYFASLHRQEVLFEDLINGVDLPKDPGRNVLFDTMFIYQNMDMPVLSGELYVAERFEFDPGFSKYDLSIEFMESPEGMSYYLEYATQLFSEATIRKIGDSFTCLVESILQAPDLLIKDLQVITAEERQQLLAHLNNTATAFPLEKTLHRLFEERAFEFPDHVAIVHGACQLTYGELDARANEMAGWLTSKGIQPQETVCVYMDNSIHLIVALLGIMKAGGAFVPIDPTFPDKRKQFIYEDSSARFIVTKEVLITRDNAVWSDVPRHCLLVMDGERNQVSSCENLFSDLSSDHLAYLIYTSGTTGMPKGVAIEHRNMVNYVCWAIDTYLITGQATAFPLFTPVTFDLTLTAIFVPLLSGNTIHIYSGAPVDELLQEILTDNKVGAIKLTPAHLKLLDVLAPALFSDESNVKKFIVGGEALSTKLAASITRKFSHPVEIFNEYGPTETTVGCIVHKFDPDKDLHEFVPIGKPIANTQVYILDVNKQLVPQGVTGELYISGAGVGRGYWRKEQLTAAVFHDDPFAVGQRMYSSGDIARVTAGLELEYKGRKDRQVKVRGYRIEIQEIEARLSTHPFIKEAVVLVNKPEVSEDYLICAYYVCETPVQVPVLEDWLGEFLPAYMIPAIWIPVDSIPLTLNGKTDYELLATFKNNEAEIRSDELLSELEADIMRVFGKVLHRTEISIRDNFYAIGGDSVKAVQVSGLLRNQGITLKPADILRYRTIRHISLHARYHTDSVKPTSTPAYGIKDASPIEKWFWELQLAEPAYYNQSVLISFQREINKALLADAFTRLIHHHDGLRLNFDINTTQGFYNDDHLRLNFKLEEADISHLDYTEQEKELAAIGGRLKSGFDLAHDLLLKGVLIRYTATTYKLLCTAHHLIVDGVSWRILLDDLYNIYCQLENGLDVALPARTTSLVQWIKALKDNKDFATELDFWKKAYHTSFKLPAAFPVAGAPEKNKIKLTSTLDEHRTAILITKTAMLYKTDPAVVICLALVKALKDWTGYKECIVMMEGHGRNLQEMDVSRTVGWFTAIYPVLLTVQEETIGRQITAVKEQIRKVPAGGIGYGVLKYLYPGLLPGNKQQAAVRFNYLGELGEFDNDLFRYESVDTGMDSSPDNHLSAGLDILCMVVAGKLQTSFQFPGGMFAGDTIKQFEFNFKNYLNTTIQYLDNEKDINLSPSDFTSAALDSEDIAALFSS